MKEIIYIQAGNFANHIGTHFWNTQESYFTFGEEEDSNQQSSVAHDISFREGVSTDRRTETFCPRLLIFDQKDNFGTLARNNALYHDLETEDTDNEEIMQIDVIQRAGIEKSDYQKHLDLEVNYRHSSEESTENRSENPFPQPEDVRYWSDYNRVFYLPRSLHTVSQSQTWRKAERTELINNVTEDSFRHFAEECDLLQGIISTFDTSTFGPLSLSLLEHIRDDFPKLPLLSSLCLEEPTMGIVAVDDTRRALSIVVDAAILGNLLVWSHSLTVPLQPPSTWMLDSVAHPLSLKLGSRFHTSAVLSCHLESVTFPQRARSTLVDLDTFCRRMNWREDTPLVNISGCLPIHAAAFKSSPIVLQDFSSWGRPVRRASSLSGRIVGRGIPALVTDDEVVKALPNEFSFPLVDINRYQAYPIPDSFPQFFGPAAQLSAPVRMVSCIASLEARSHMYQPLLQMADFVNQFAKRGQVDNESVVEMFGGGREELRDLSENLRQIGENWAGGGWDDTEEEYEGE
ncbi:mtDNA inheritance, partitioning of the mitochondrial organelle [Tulasnella sp. 418]|nr:mtDNA inheritance, partitioning of the mitochondrial organelle [Tulasnella sp. 418]